MNPSWHSVPLGELLKKSDDWITIDPSSTYQQVTVRLWGKGVVKRDQVPGSEIASARRLSLRAGDFLVSRIDARNGAFGIVPPYLDRAVVSNDFPAFRVNCSRLDAHYLEWLSKTPHFVDLCRAASEGTTNRVRLKEERFLSMSIALPPLEEQRRIVAKIGASAGKIEQARQLHIQNEISLSALLASAYQDVIHGAPRLPMHAVAPLVRRPITIKSDATYPELGVRSFGKGTFHKPPLPGAEVGTKRLFGIEPGDLLFNIVFAWEGAVAVARPEDQGRVGSHRFLTCVPDPTLAVPEFLWFHFLTSEGLAELGTASPGGAGRNRTLGMKALQRIEVPIPSRDDQEWFASLLIHADEVSTLRDDVGAELNILLTSILNKAFRGEL